MEGYRRKPRRDTVHRHVCGYKTEVKENIEIRQRLALRNKVKDEEDLRDLREVKRRNRNENVFARPNRLRENPETAISCRGPGPAKKRKEVYLHSRGGGRRRTDVPLWQSSREQNSHTGKM